MNWIILITLLVLASPVMSYANKTHTINEITPPYFNKGSTLN